MLGAVPIVIPATNYYNPFGPVGSPNRLAVTNAPAGGLAISLVGYRPVDAGARKTEVVGLHGDALKIRLAAPPVDGKANAALLDFLAKRIGLARSSVTLISGQASRRKVVEIAENVVDLEKRLFA